MKTILVIKNCGKTLNGKSIAWDDDEVIYIGSQANSVVKEFAIWVKNDEEGRTILKIISEKISNLKK